MATYGAEEEAAAHAARMRAGVLSLVVGALLFAGKLFAWRITGSAAVLSDALESIINIVAAGGLVYSLVVAARPADETHPYGHGKVEFFSAGVEGACIAIAAVLIGVESVYQVLVTGILVILAVVVDQYARRKQA